MKSTILRLLVVPLCFWILAGCGNGNSESREEIIALKRAHDTRLTGLCRTGDTFFEKSFHASEKILCGDAIIHTKEYLKHKEYAPLPGKEVKFQEYLEKSKK